MNYVYIYFGLVDRRFYIGYTKDLRRRDAEHKAGKVQSTEHRQEMRLIFYEAYVSEVDARRRERYFKSSKGKDTLRNMLTDTLTKCS